MGEATFLSSHPCLGCDDNNVSAPRFITVTCAQSGRLQLPKNLSPVGQAFLPAGSGDFPAPSWSGGLESPPNRPPGKAALRSSWSQCAVREPLRLARHARHPSREAILFPFSIPCPTSAPSWGARAGSSSSGPGAASAAAARTRARAGAAPDAGTDTVAGSGSANNRAAASNSDSARASWSDWARATRSSRSSSETDWGWDSSSGWGWDSDWDSAKGWGWARDSDFPRRGTLGSTACAESISCDGVSWKC